MFIPSIVYIWGLNEKVELGSKQYVNLTFLIKDISMFVMFIS